MVELHTDNTYTQAHLHAFIFCLFLCWINYWHLWHAYVCSSWSLSRGGAVPLIAVMEACE